MFRSCFGFVAIAVTALLVTANADAQPVFVGPEFQVNTYTTSDQYASRVAMAPGGDFVVVWSSYGSSGTDSFYGSVHGQRYASDGSTLGAEFQVNSYTTDQQGYASVAINSGGDFVVVWPSIGSSGTDSSDYSVQGQRYASDGNRLGTEFQINTYTTDTQTNPSVAMHSGGDFVVVWDSIGSSGTDSASYSVQGQRFASDGSRLGSEFQINTYTTNLQTHARVAMDSSGNFAAVWRSKGSSGTDFSNDSVQGQRYASDGSRLGSEFQVNTYTSNVQSQPSVAMDSSGDFVVVWDSIGSSGADSSNYSVQGQRYASDGSGLGSEFEVNTYTTNLQFRSDVAMDSSGNFVVAWYSKGSSGTDSSEHSVQGQRYTSDGSRLQGEFQVNTYTTNLQRLPTVAMDSSGAFVAVWQSRGSSGTDSSRDSIQGQLFRQWTCGDGFQEPGEECDDGNTDDLDGCDASCVDEFCGDGITNDAGNEECDDGNTVSGDGCDSSCVDEFCGDGITNDAGNEECDDGNTVDGDGCDSNCVDEFCGDGVTNDAGNEECDDGNTVDGDGCDSSCVHEFCGDGITNDAGNEECDDGNTVSGDGCDSSCVDEFCGDGVTNDAGNEECDDGNTVSGDGCDSSCADEFCGDGVTNNAGTEECDDGNTVSGDGCDSSCVDEFCGDGATNDAGKEECDDGNTDDLDGCDSSCVDEFCGDGITNNAGKEECDDGNANNLDACYTNCNVNAHPLFVGPEFQVNAYTPSSQYYPSVAMNSGGDFVVVWASYGSSGSDSSGSSIQGQRYASDGSTLGTEFQIDAYTTDNQDGPRVAMNSGGDFVVVWQSNGSSGTDSSNESVQGQRYASDGSTLGSEFQVNTYTTGAQNRPNVAMNSGGNFLVVWHSKGSSGSDSSGSSIQGQRYASDGSTLGTEFQVNTYTTSAQSFPSVAMDSSGKFAVAWQSGGSSGTDSASSVQGQRYASDGSRLGNEFQVNTYTENSQKRPRVAMDSGGDFVVVWQSYGSSGTDSSEESIQGQRYASDGSTVGSEFQANTHTALRQRNPRVAMDPGGNFVVAWRSESSSGTDSSDDSIQGRRYASDGSTPGRQFQINSYTTSYQWAPSVAMDSSGAFAVAWTSLGSSGTDSSDESVQGKRFRAWICGDGIQETGEECDDGNTDDLDGCDSSCVDEFCGDGITNDAGNEDCDDGNTDFARGEYCAEDCTAVPCGKPTNGPTPNPTTTDALFSLGSAVGSRTCDLRVCDVNNSGTLTTTDALIILKKAVGQDMELNCPTEPPS